MKIEILEKKGKGKGREKNRRRKMGISGGK